MAVDFGGEASRDDGGAAVRIRSVLSSPVTRGIAAVVIAAVVLPLLPCPGREVRDPSRACDALDGNGSAPVESDTRRFPPVGSVGRRGEGARTGSLALAGNCGVADTAWELGLVGLGTGRRGLAIAATRLELGTSCLRGDVLIGSAFWGEDRTDSRCPALRSRAGVCFIGDCRRLFLGRKSGGRNGSFPIILLHPVSLVSCPVHYFT